MSQLPSEGVLDISPVLRVLERSVTLQVLSDSGPACEVEAKAKQARAESRAASLLKTPTPVGVPSLLRIRAADVLLELGVATTFLSHPPFREVAQSWAHVWYCATLQHARRGFLSLTEYAANDVVHHHKVAQSEQLGVGLALVVTRAVLGKRHSGYDIRVDADVALAASYVDGGALEVFQGVEHQLHRDLTEGRFLAYQRRAGILRRWWHERGRYLTGEALSVGNDGTALVMRIVDRRGE